ncbi:RHS repeat-associated core domain-containing protein [Collimonas arenae]|nr:RHS repeat-associated core domain-containing protein [Collimonas arenae]
MLNRTCPHQFSNTDLTITKRLTNMAISFVQHWRTRRIGSRVGMTILGFLMACAIAQAQTPSVGVVSPPNGTFSQEIVDLQVQTPAGEVSWRRVFNGTGWRFNRHWDGISASYKPLSTQSTGGGAGSNMSGGGQSGCWVWVDEDWSPGAAVAGGAFKVDAISYIPFNQVYSQQGQPLQVFNVNSCASLGASSEIFEGYRRLSGLYVGGNGSYVFKNRYTLKKQSSLKLPITATVPGGNPQSGSVSVSSAITVQGWRWQDRKGDWVEYDSQGQISRYGDKNDNVVWMQRDTQGRIERLIEGSSGKTIFTLHYNSAGYLVEIRDYSLTGNGLDLPQRSVKYAYDPDGQLISVTDARGFVTNYNYDAQHRLSTITDPEQRASTISYDGESSSVSKLIAADGGQNDYSFSYDDAKKFFYSKLQGPVTASGRRVEDYTHDRAGDLVKYEVNGRTDVAVTRDPGARTETRVNARGFTTVLTKNEFEQVVQVKNEDGTFTSTQFDARNLNPIETVDEAGIKNQFAYDAKGNLIQRTQAAGTADERVTDYQLDNAGRVSRATLRGRAEENGVVTQDAVWQFTYDGTGQLAQTIDPEGNLSKTVYDRNGNLVNRTDARGNSTAYQVDAMGNLLQTTDALGNVRHMSYDKVGNLVTFTDARSKATQSAYDAMNRRIQINSPAGGSYKIEYNAQGLPIRETNEDGHGSQAEFDNFLRVVKQIDALGNATQYGYQIPDGSSSGQLGSLATATQVKYPTFVQQTKYDARERPTTEALLNPNALGIETLVSSSVYDKRGQVSSDTDANGKTRFSKYDSFGQLVESTDSLGNKTSAKFDVRGNLLQIKDARGNVNNFEYDRDNRVVKEILPLGQVTAYRYDAAGNLASRVDPNGNKSVFTYDAADRLIEVKQTNAVGLLARTTSITWDNESNAIGWKDTDHIRNQTASSSLTFDDADRKTTETVTYPNGVTLGYAYAYSAAGLKTRLTWPDGVSLDYGYSAHDELESVNVPGEGLISVTQFKWTSPAKVTLPGGTTQELGYDGLLNLESVKVRSPGQQTTLSVQNLFGKIQELQKSVRTDSAGGGGTTRASSFSYDDESRLTEVTTDAGGLFGSDTENFTLDAAGNRIAHSKVNGAWQYDANNRLTQRGTGGNATNYEYDPAGNLIKKIEGGNKITQYSYDTQNRLIEVADGNGSVIARYGYDPQDRRIWKEQYRDVRAQSLPQAKRTIYLYSDEGLIAESEQDIALNADGSVSAGGPSHIVTEYGPRPNSDFGTANLFIKTKSSNGQDTIAYYHLDQLGTPIQATDKQGNVVWSANYNVFGQAAITTPVATADKPTIISNLRLPGQIEDAETGLYYNYRRYYDPSTGRYITQDPIGLAGGDNQYRYADANPANLSDPTGECPMCAAYAWCVAECMLEDVAANAITGECNNFGKSAKSCALSCLVGPFGRLGKWFKRGEEAACAINSFPSDTLVHVKPANANRLSAQQAKSNVRPINKIQVGDQVLAFSESKSKGANPKLDSRLSYEKVTNVFVSNKSQTLVHIFLDSGESITATEGHPFKTTDGWRDAILLKKGGRLLLMGDGGDSDAKSLAIITDVQSEQKVLPVFNIEVANAHTYFVGVDGELVHNAHGHHCFPKYLGGAVKQKLTKLSEDLHKLYHKGLDQVAPRWKGKAHYDGLPAAEKDKVLDKFKDYTEGFDKTHGTDLLNGARSNGFPK